MNISCLKYFILILFFFISLKTYSQISQPGEPWGYSNELPNDFEFKKMPRFKKRQANQAEKKYRGKQFVYATTYETNITPDNSGIWKTLNDGTKIWLVGIKSKNAYSIGIIFNAYKIPEGSELYIYNSTKTDYKGAFTSLNNKKNKKLTIAPIKGDEIIIEYQEPRHAEYKGVLNIGLISHDYKDILNTYNSKDNRFGLSGSCNIDINCSLGDDWQEVKTSVCRIYITGNKYCTATLINNTFNDAKPYLLTANHCVYNESEANSVLAVFNYESPYCDGTDGSVSQTISGATLKATSTHLDFSLIELSATPPDEYKPIYAGWNNNSEASEKVTTIGHPKGDVKKIAQDLDTADTGNDLGTPYNAYSFWQIEDWEYGTTEDGSSGSGLFDTNKRIIGILSSGDAVCGDPVDDFYTKFDLAWDYYIDTNEQLKYWLDPENSGVETLDAFNPRKPKYDYDMEITKIIEPFDSYCGDESFIPKLIVRNTGLDTVFNYKIRLSIDSVIIDSIQVEKILTTYNFDTVEFAEVAINEDTFDYSVQITSINDSIDENLDNNISNSSYVVKMGKVTELKLVTDLYGMETTWEIKDSNNTIIYSGGPYPNEVQSHVNEEFCFDYGKYIFSIYDSQGDGICCDFGAGSYKIINPDNNNILVSGGIFSDLAVDTFNIVETEYMADFYTDTQTVYFNSPVQFYDNSLNAIKWNWHFEGGTPESSTEQNPIVTYSDTGLYDVSLAINDSTHLLIVENYINVIDSPIVVNFMTNKTITCEKTEVHFTNLSKRAETYMWSFPGGKPNSSLDENPVIYYSDTGTYDVGLKVDNSDEYELIKTDYIHVTGIPILDIIIVDNSASASIDEGTPPYNYYWSTNETTDNISGLDTGLYSLTIIDSAGCIVTKPFEIPDKKNIISNNIYSKNYHIYPNPASDFINILTNYPGYYKVIIYNMMGKMVKEKELNADRSKLSIHDLLPGTYFIRLYRADGIDNNKIVIN